jgi:SpoVK/Ycf46/Vps4 family AAA+-type ATPase
MTNPELFTGARAVPKGLLLFGPPGTGKTMIGKAVASQCKATFFSISASSLTSKWIGDGEKMVRALFAVARHCAPSVIFVDEIDSLLSARKSEGEHESSRRMKTEFLVQMDGLGGEDPTKPMLLIGATNRPQELDDGARRRLAKQLYIPLPCAAARRDMILKTLNPDGEGKVKHALTEKDLDLICEKTDGYSGSDLKNLVQEAARAPLRELFAKKKARTEKGDGGGDVVDLTKSGEDEALELREIRIDDIRKAAKQVRASVTRADIEFHEEWNKKHGALTADEVEDDGEW